MGAQNGLKVEKLKNAAAPAASTKQLTFGSLSAHSAPLFLCRWGNPSSQPVAHSM